MKHIVLFFAASLTLTASATIRTVSNNPSTVAQFNTIQSAVDAASSGDTLYVHGSPNNYDGFLLNNKRLAIIGPGWSPNKLLPLTVNIVGAAHLNGAGTAGSELQGLVFQSNISINSLGVDNIRFIRNRIIRNLFYLTPSVGGTIRGYVFEGNWFDNAVVISNVNYLLENFLFQNNLFYENNTFTSGNINGFVNTVNVLFDHNLWYGPSSGTRDAFAGNCRFLTVTNNVFVRRNAAGQISNSFFNNNITYLAGNDVPWTLNNNIDNGGNLAGVDPQLAAQTEVNNGVANALLDFSIAAGPANNSGTDGKDRGLLYDAAGSLNWLYSRASRVPFIYSMQVTTPTVAPGGSVSVTVEARSAN